MEATVIEDAKVLIPNNDHQNFTEGKDVIIKGEHVTGEPKVVAGLRRGQPFNYRLFLTNNNKLIYLNKIKPMETTEVKLGANATIVNLKQNILAKPVILGAISGAIIGLGYSKYKKHDMKKILIYTLSGALAGGIIGKIISHKATVKQTK